MIYLDSSVVLAYLLSEDRSPPDTLWEESLGSSRLLEYEVWNRVHRSSKVHGDSARALLNCIQLAELTPNVLSRALQAFSVPVRTLDSLHLATIEYLRGLDSDIALASFDERMLASARALNIPIYKL